MNAFSILNMKVLAPVVQDLDSAIHRIYRHPVDQYHESHCVYLLDSVYPVDSPIHLLNIFGQVYMYNEWNRQMLVMQLQNSNLSSQLQISA